MFPFFICFIHFFFYSNSNSFDLHRAETFAKIDKLRREQASSAALSDSDSEDDGEDAAELKR